MKFDALYNQIFIAEAGDEQNKAASPEDVEIEPLPLPAPALAPVEGEEGIPSSPVTGGGTISDYVLKIQEFADSLNSVDGECLNKLVKRLDKPSTPYEGIAGRTSTDIVRVSEGLRGIAENLINFTISAAAGSSNA